MTLILSGTDGVSDIDGTAATPAIRGTDTNTGIFFPAADTIAFAEGGAEAMRIDSSGNVGIGTSSPAANTRLNVASSGETKINMTTTGTGSGTRIFLNNQNGYDLEILSSGDASGVTNLGLASNSQTGVGANYILSGTKLAIGTYNNYETIFGTNNAERMRIDSAGNVGIGTTSVTSGFTFEVKGEVPAYFNSTSTANTATYGGVVFYRATNTASNGNGIAFRLNNSSSAAAEYAYIGGLIETNTASSESGSIIFAPTSAGTRTERARITSDGYFYVGTTVNVLAGNTAGINLFNNGQANYSVDGNVVLYVNRKTSDGTLIQFRQDNTEEGSISVSGNTVSYNAFAGSHWSQLQQGRGYNPDILRGTVMSSIGEMCEWKSVTWTETIEHPAVLAVEAKEAVLDEEGNVIEPAIEAVEGKDAWTETFNKREAYLGNLPVGATFEEDGVTKTVVDDGNERLPKVKISDVVGDKAVYGVFQTWDEVQDMLVTSLGAFVVRIASGVTVQIGDLLESNGDGCAKVQDDDVIRSKTIGKVTSITPSATYADGSYTVPAVLYCG